MLKFLQSGNWGKEKGKCGKEDQCSVPAWFSHFSQETGTGHSQFQEEKSGVLEVTVGKSETGRNSVQFSLT